MNLQTRCTRPPLLFISIFFLALAAQGFAVSIDITAPTNDTTISDTTPDLNFTTSGPANVTYSWDGEGTISGCRNCDSFNTTYGENDGSDANLVALWHFNEMEYPSLMYDETSNDNDGKLGGTGGTQPTQVEKGFAYALDFDGNDFVNVSDSPSLDLTKNLAMVAWVRPELGTWPQNAFVVGKENAYAFRFYYGKLSFLFYDGTTWNAHNSSVEVTRNTWSHVAATYNSTTVKLYINGAEVYSGPETATINGTDYDLRIGSYANSTGWERYFNGIIDDVAIYNRSLLGAEIQELYNKSLSIDPNSLHNVTVYANDGTLNSTTRYFTVTLPVHNEDSNIYYLTIQEAVDNANSSDTITVDARKYNESVNITKPLNIVGAGAVNTVVESPDVNNPVFYIGANAIGVNISGLRIASAENSSGIYIDGASNVNISNNVLRKNGRGIYLRNSSNSIISNNNASLNTGDGIYINSSNYNNITNNIADSNGLGGISLWNSSNYNTISNNTANSNIDYDGIYINSSSYNTIINNIANLNNNTGIALVISDNNIITNNIADSNDWGGIYLYNSSSNNITNNTATFNADDGIYLYNSKNSTISGNNASNNLYLNGIALDENSDNTLVENNILNSNKNNGIYLYNSSNNTITNNTADSNDWSGIHLNSGSYNILENNTVNSNKNTGITIVSSGNNTITNNTADSNYWDGIYLYNSSYNNITNNTATFNVDNGIYLYNSKNGTISGNNASNNLYRNGIALDENSDNALVENNILNSNKNNGIGSWNSNNLTIINNTAMYNGGSTHQNSGIYLNFSNNNNIINNTFYDNYEDFNSINSFSNTITSNLFNDTRASFTYSGDISVNSSSPPAGGTPRNWTGIGRYLNVTNASAAWVFLNISYADVELGETINYTLRMYRHNGTAWENVGGTNGVDTSNNYVYANITEFSVFAPLGKDNTTPSIEYNPDTTEVGNYSRNWIFVNVSINESNLDIVALEIGSKNYTNPQTDGANYWWNETLFEDIYTIKVYASDTAGNTNATGSRTIRLDTTPPDITMILPGNTTYNYNEGLPLNFTLSEPADWCGYSLNGEPDVTISACQNMTFNVSGDGPHNITVYANDSASNLDSSIQYFTVDNTNPAVFALQPSAGNYSGTIDINASVTDATVVDNMYWWWDNGTTGPNQTLNGTLDTTTLADGSYTIRYWANDTLGNVNATESVTITVDNTPSGITIYSPSNITTTVNNPDLNFTTSDTTNVTYAWDGEGNISGCRNCDSFNTTYGENNGSDPNIVGLWHFNENAGTITYDDSNYANDGDFVNAPAWNATDCKFGPCVDFDGTDYVNISGSSMEMTGTSITVALWLKLDTITSGSNFAVIRKGSETSLTPTSWAVFHKTSSDDKIRMRVDNATDKVLVDTTDPVVANQWYHIAFTYDGSITKLYVDGVLNNSAPHSGNILGTTDMPVMIGRWDTTYLDGKVDEVAIYNRTLSDGEIADLYNRSLTDGQHNATIYAADSVGNLNLTTRYFTVDTTPPTITTDSPLNKTHGTGSIDYKITVNEPLNWANVSINGTANMTMSNSSQCTSQCVYSNLSGGHLPLLEGTHNATFYVQDLMGYINQTTVYFTVNYTAPNINITSPENTTYGNGSLPYNMTITNDVNLTGARVEVNGSNYTLINSSGTPADWYNTTVGELSEGYYNATFYADSILLNSTDIVYFTVDTSPPYNIILDYPQNNSNVSSQNITFNWRAYDNISTQLGSNLTINGAVNESDISTGNGTLISRMVHGLSDGIYGWNVTTWDQANNTNISVTYYFTVDTVPPDVSFITPDSNENISGSVYINVTAADITTGVYNVSIQIGTGENWVEMNLFGGNISEGNWFYLWNTSTSAEGNITLKINATDFAGTANTTVTRNVIVDNTNPAVFALQPSAGNYSGTIEINASVTDAAVVDTMYWWWDNGTTGPNQTLNGTLDTTTLADGSYTIRYWANDTLGNVNATESVTITVDNTNPAVFALQPSAGTYAGTIEINASVTDAAVVDAMYWWWDNGTTGPNQTLNGTLVTTTLADGVYTIRYWANDTLGNVNATESVTITVDNTGPSIFSIQPSAGNYSGTIDINASVTDATEVDTMYWWWDNGTTGPNQTLNGTLVTTTLADGSYTIKYWANDTLGNVNATESVTIAVSNIPPNMTFISPTNDTITDNSPDLNFTTNKFSNIVYSWNGEGNITGCKNCNLFDATYGESKKDVDSFGLWHFNENDNSTLTDDSGQSNHGTISGATWTQGRFGSALYFDGSASVEVPDNNDTLDFSVNDSFTIGVWIKTDSEMEFILSKRVSSPTPSGWELYLLDGMLEFKMKNSSGAEFVASTIEGSKLNDSNWHHAAVTYNGTSKNGSLYVDGNVVGSAINSLTGYTNNSLSLHIGRKQGTANYFFNGTIDDIHIMRRALSAAEIAAEYNNILEDDSHNVTVWAEDANVGNLNYTTVYFTVDATPPTISDPQFNETQVYPGVAVRFNVTVTGNADVDTVIATFRYPNATETNKTLLNTTDTYYYNWTDTSANGTYNVTYIWTNDTYGNVNATVYTDVSFMAKDAVAPTWDQIPFNQPAEANTTFTYDVNASDNAIVTYFINDTTNFAINATNGIITNKTVLNFGSYSLNISVNDTSGNTNSTVITITVEDTIAPAITITSPTPNKVFSAGTNKVTINMSIAEFNPDTLFIDWGGSDGNVNYGSYNSSSRSITGPPNDVLYNGGAYIFHIWANDTSGNAAQTSISISVASGDSGGDSPGGNGAPSPTSTPAPTVTLTKGVAVITFSSIDIGSPATFTVPDTEDVYLTQLLLAVKKKVTNVRLTVSTLDTRPEAIGNDIEGIVYKYLDIVHENVDNEDVSIVILTFKVEKSWIDDNDIDLDSITLNRYSGGKWTALTATRLSCDSDYCYHEVGSPGLSVFGISGSVATATDAPTTTTPTSTPPPTSAPTVTGSLSPSPMTQAPIDRPIGKLPSFREGKPFDKTVIVVVISLVILIVAYMYYRHRRREGKWWDDRIKSTEDEANWAVLEEGPKE